MAPTELVTSPPAQPAFTGRAGALHRAGAEVLDAEYSEAASLHLRDYLRVIDEYRWLAGTCFALTFALAVLATALTTRTYTATTRLQVARHSPIQLQLEENVLRVDGDERSVNGSSSFLATQVAILRSRDLAERVVRTHRLGDSEWLRDPSARAGVVDVGGRVLNLLRPRGWRGPAESRERDTSLAPEEADRAALGHYLSFLAVNEVRGTDLIDITFTTPAADLSAFLAAAHSQAYLEANEEARLVTNVTAKAFLGEQLRESREQLDRAEAALREFAAQYPSIAIDSEHKVESLRIQQLSEELTRVEGLRVSMESRYDFLRQPDTDPLAYFLDKPGVQKLRLALLEAEAQDAAASDRLGGAHPDMVLLRRQETALRGQLATELTREVGGVRARWTALRLREERVREKLEAQEQHALAQQTLGARYAILAKDVETAQALRDSLLKQQMETAVNSELAASNIRVVDRAEVPSGPARPNVPLNLALGAFVGVLVAVGATLVVDYFDSSVKSSEDVETLLRLPTLGIIPSFARMRRRSGGRAGARDADAATGAEGGDLVVHREPRSLVAEAFRTMRTAVLFSAPGQPPQVIVLTSAGQGEGKTTSSLNLATTLAAAGSQVILVDGDLRRPSCHRALGMANDDGLSRYLAGHTPLDAVVRETEVPNLAFVPAGPMPPNPAELVGSTRMRDAVACLRERYDFVIIDSPPTLPVTDAVLLARQADGVVLVVKGHDTPRELVRRARDQLATSGAHLLGALVNNVASGWGDGYGYGRYYGAYYGASSGEGAA